MTARARFPWLLLAILVSTQVLDWVFDKIAVLHSEGVGLEYYTSLFVKPWVWFGIVISPFQLWLWNKILTRIDLSAAYPATSLSYPLTMLAMMELFGEHLSLQVWTGGLMITAGVALIGLDRGRTEVVAHENLEFSAPLKTPPFPALISDDSHGRENQALSEDDSKKAANF